MKPKVRWSRSLSCWCVHRGTRSSLHETWPAALAALGIPCPDGWQR